MKRKIDLIEREARFNQVLNADCEKIYNITKKALTDCDSNMLSIAVHENRECRQGVFVYETALKGIRKASLTVRFFSSVSTSIDPVATYDVTKWTLEEINNLLEMYVY